MDHGTLVESARARARKHDSAERCAGNSSLNSLATMRSRSLAGAAVASLTLLLQSACGSTTPTNTNVGTPTCTVGGVSVSASPTAINTGATTTLTASVIASSSCSGGVTWAATPSGGTLTPNGLSATFTTATAGTYSIS